MAKILDFPVGTKIRFLKRLDALPTGDRPGIVYAEQGETGEIVQSVREVKEGYMVKTDSWPTPFGASYGTEFEVLLGKLPEVKHVDVEALKQMIFRPKASQTVEARQLHSSTREDIHKWIGEKKSWYYDNNDDSELYIQTSNGVTECAVAGDWVVMGIDQEYRVFSPEQFGQLYEYCAEQKTPEVPNDSVFSCRMCGCDYRLSFAVGCEHCKEEGVKLNVGNENIVIFQKEEITRLKEENKTLREDLFRAGDSPVAALGVAHDRERRLVHQIEALQKIIKNHRNDMHGIKVVHKHNHQLHLQSIKLNKILEAWKAGGGFALVQACEEALKEGK